MSENVKQKTVPRVHERVSLELTRGCNHSCVYCGPECGPGKERQDRMGFADFVSALTILKIVFGTKHVSLLGGEPFMCPYLIELVRWCTNQMFKTVVITNGSLVTPKQLEELSKLDLTLVVSIQAGDEECANKVARLDGSHQASLRTIAHAIELGIDIEVTMRKFKLNAHTAEAAKEQLLRMGVPEKKIGIFPVQALGRGEKLALTDSSISSRYSEQCLTCNSGNITINSLGDVYPCFVGRKPVGNLLEQDLVMICNSEAFSDGLEVIRLDAQQDTLLQETLEGKSSVVNE